MAFKSLTISVDVTRKWGHLYAESTDGVNVSVQHMRLSFEPVNSLAEADEEARDAAQVVLEQLLDALSHRLPLAP